MLSQRAVSGVKLLGIGSLATVSLVGLMVGSFLGLMMWLPFPWALKILDVATLDVFRIFYAPSYTVIVPLVVMSSASMLGLSIWLGKRLHASPKKVAYTMLSVFIVALMVSSVAIPSTMAISSTQTAEYNQFHNQPCTFYVFTDGTNYYAQDCTLGSITYGGPGNAGGATGTSFSSVWANINSNNFDDFLAPGTFTITAGLGLNANNFILRGSGNMTIIKVGNAANINQVFQIQGGSGATFSNFVIDANGGQQTTPVGGIIGIYMNVATRFFTLNGISIERATAQSLKFTTGTTSDIKDITVINNVFNQGNVLPPNSAKDFSVNIQAKYVTFSNNVMVNSNAEDFDCGSCLNVIIANNRAQGTTNTGIDVGNAKNVTITSNILSSIGGSSTPSIYAESTSGFLTIANNVVTGGTASGKAGIKVSALATSSGRNPIVISNNVVSKSYNGIYLNGLSNALVEGNTVINSTNADILYDNAGSISPSNDQIIGNTLYANAGTAFGIQDAEASFTGKHVDIKNNLIYCYSTTPQGIAAGNDSLIEGNTVVGCGFGINAEAVASGFNQYIIGNRLIKDSSMIGNIRAGIVILNNPGYNPLGSISSPFDTTKNYVADGAIGADTMAASPNNSTATTVVGSPKFICYTVTTAMTGGQTTVIKVDGTQIISQASLGTTFSWCATLNPGQTVFFTYHTGKGTFVVSGE